MKTLAITRSLLLGSAFISFVVFLFLPQEAGAKEFSSVAINCQNLKAPPMRIRPPLFFPAIKVAFVGRTEQDEYRSASFQGSVIEALNEIDRENMDLLDDLIDAADEVSDCGSTTNVTIDGENNVEIYRPSGPIVLEWTGTELRVRSRPSLKAVMIDCFPLLVKKRLLPIPGIAKVNTSRLILYAQPKRFAERLKLKLCLN